MFTDYKNPSAIATVVTDAMHYRGEDIDEEAIHATLSIPGAASVFNFDDLCSPDVQVKDMFANRIRKFLVMCWLEIQAINDKNERSLLDSWDQLTYGESPALYLYKQIIDLGNSHKFRKLIADTQTSLGQKGVQLSRTMYYGDDNHVKVSDIIKTLEGFNASTMTGELSSLLGYGKQYFDEAVKLWMLNLSDTFELVNRGTLHIVEVCMTTEEWHWSMHYYYEIAALVDSKTVTIS
jgi:hypothetical protein